MVALLNRPTRLPSARGAERRIFPRREVRGQVEGRRLDHALEALRRPCLQLTLNDLSLGGLAADSELPLAEGERLDVSFPAHGLSSGWDARGRVVRCQPAAFGYRVAIAFDPLPAA